MSDTSLYENETDRCQKHTCPELEAADAAASIAARKATQNKRNTKTLFCGLAALVLFLIGLGLTWKDWEMNNNSVAVEAKVERVFGMEGMARLSQPYELWYGYAIDGKAYGGKTGYPRMLHSGESLMVKVSRSAPDKSFVPGADDIIPQVLTFGASLAFVILCALSLRQRSETGNAGAITTEPTPTTT